MSTGSDAIEKSKTLRRIHDILWPPDDPDAPWSADTFDRVASELMGEYPGLLRLKQSGHARGVNLAPAPSRTAPLPIKSPPSLATSRATSLTQTRSGALHLIQTGAWSPVPPAWWIRSQLEEEGRPASAAYAIWHKNYNGTRKFVIWDQAPDEDWFAAGYPMYLEDR